MMRRFAEMIAKVFMETLTVVFAAMGCMLVNDVLYEYVDNWYGETWQAALIGVIGYMVIRYQTRTQMENYMMNVSPKVIQLISAVNRITNADDKDEAA